jgi:lysozyme
MMYQMGEQGLFEFRRMWTALDKLDFELAAQEALDSVWAKQTPDRAERIAEVIRTGEMTPYS